MAQEDKQLLLKDLCARLPYGVKVQNVLDDLLILDLKKYLYCLPTALVPNFKPYLRPMSSMTEEEAREWAKASNMKFDMEDGFLDAYDAHLSVDWLNAHHFDFRNLIGKGLALEAPEGMYKIE